MIDAQLKLLILSEARDIIEVLKKERAMIHEERPSGISDSNLDGMIRLITELLRELIETETIANRRKYRPLTRIIMDQWPLGNSLGNRIITLEERCVELLGVQDVSD